MRYTRVYADRNGETHFEDVDVEMKSVDFAPPAPSLNLSDFIRAARLAFLHAPAGWVGDWHPAPNRQMTLYLAGRIEAQTSDGEQRIFGPGSVVLVEDTAGTGHRSRVVGTEDVLMAVVQLPDEVVAD